MTDIEEQHGHRRTNSSHSSDDSTETDQPCSRNWQAKINEKLKHKSSLCRNYEEYGYCPYGYKCQFAHGTKELRCNYGNNSLYKTKLCTAFFHKKYCKYGYRCNFSHQNQTEFSEPITQEQKQNLNSYRCLIYEAKTMNGSRIFPSREQRNPQQ